MASAVELHLRNGDRLTGDFIERRDGKIYFRSPFLGEIAVPETDAVLVESPETPVESLAGIPPAASTLPRPTSTPTGHGKIAKPIVPPWRGKVEMGFQQQTGRTDGVEVSLRADADKKVGIDSYHAEARILYSEQYQQVTSDRYDGLFRYRHELSDDFFGQAQTSYTRDRLKLINDDLEEDFGIGYKMINLPRHKGNIGAGVTAQYRDAAGIETGVSNLGELFEDYTYKLTGRVTISQDASVAYSPETRDRLLITPNGSVPTDQTATNYRLRFNAALQGKVTDRVSLNLRFEYEFDNAILDPKAKVDQRVTSSVGYGF